MTEGHNRVNLTTRLNICATVILFIVIAVGCARDVEPAANAESRHPRQEATGDREQIDGYVDQLGAESLEARRDAVDALAESLKSKIYFDPAAPAEQRQRQLDDVRRMWTNLKRRDLVEAVQNHAPLQYFFDLNTGELFEERHAVGPVETDSGPYNGMPAGVRAIVFACHDCSSIDDRFVGWLELRSMTVREYGVDVAEQSLEGLEEAIFIRSPNGGPWVAMFSDQGKVIIEQAHRCANRRVPLLCRPGR
ncbi:MAG: hypothetical protein MI757_13410 [Pirellulales bacterium]|nr:hypothetical protein [Pirellulales bacterium]